MDRKTILITGGRGFIGSYLRNYYHSHHIVYAPERSRLDFTNSASVDHFFDTHSVDIVIHTALVGRNNINGVDYEQARQNIEMFNNIWRNRHKFKQLINLGTGNEFDTTTNINVANEDTLFNRLPVASYAYAKNIIARIIRNTPNFINLRLFGVFHYTESPVRFFKRLTVSNSNFHIFQDQYFDFFNLEDLPTIIDTIINNSCSFNDLNVVYSEKYLLSEYAFQLANIKNIHSSTIVVDAVSPNNFTGDANKLQSLNLKFKGVQAGFNLY